MVQFSDVTLAILSNGGWSPKRNVDTKGYKAYLLETGQEAPQAVLTFLKSFGGIKIIIPAKTSRNQAKQINFDPVEGLETTGIDTIQAYSTNLTLPQLCAIGTWADMMLGMSASGAMYSFFDRYVNKWGNTGEEAIETICTHGTFEVISPLNKPQ